MYAGASGDFHPVHSDHVHAARQGHAGVFAHGMLTMGMSGRAVTDRFGPAGIRAFGGRMTAQVWPGDTLTARVQVTASRGQRAERVLDLAVTTLNQDGVVVFAGEATVSG
jgi:acyl dehydratase